MVEPDVGNRVAIKELTVGDVEDLPTELNCLPLPGKAERLGQAGIQSEVSGRAKNVALAHLAGARIPETLISRHRIAEQVRATVACGKRLQRRHQDPG